MVIALTVAVSVSTSPQSAAIAVTRFSMVSCMASLNSSLMSVLFAWNPWPAAIFFLSSS